MRVLLWPLLNVRINYKKCIIIKIPMTLAEVSKHVTKIPPMEPSATNTGDWDQV